MPLRPVTDPSVLAELNRPRYRPVTDPATLEALNASPGIGESLLVGAGRGFTDVGEGVKQAGMELKRLVGLEPDREAARQRLANYNRQVEAGA